MAPLSMPDLPVWPVIGQHNFSCLPSTLLCELASSISCAALTCILFPLLRQCLLGSLWCLCQHKRIESSEEAAFVVAGQEL